MRSLETKTRQFYLMHKDVITGILTIGEESDALLKWDLINKDHAPLGQEDNKAFANWLKRRAIPEHQKNKESLLNGQSNFGYMVSNLGLSLVDNYWIKPMECDLNWKDVNLYEHNFEEKDFHFENLDDLSPFKPSSTTQGELQKRWAIQDGKRILVKGNYGNMYRQSINEVFATLLHKKQGKDHTVYSFIELPTSFGRGLGCACENFSSENVEFIPAYDVTFYGKQKSDSSVLDHYVKNCIYFGIPREVMQSYVDYQILSDFLLTNTDRHLLNLGILRDATTLEFIKPAPIFDTGNAMFHTMPYIPEEIYGIQITSFYKTELRMLDQVKDRKALDLDKIPSVSELKELYSIDPYSGIYLPNLIEGYEKKIEMIEGFQKGHSLNPRSSSFYLKFSNLEKTEKDSDELSEPEKE